MAGPQKAKKSKKQRKHGRSKDYCKVYALTHRRERNKIARLRKHLVRFPDDTCARAAVDRAKSTVGGV